MTRVFSSDMTCSWNPATGKGYACIVWACMLHSCTNPRKINELNPTQLHVREKRSGECETQNGHVCFPFASIHRLLFVLSFFTDLIPEKLTNLHLLPEKKQA